MKNGTAPKYLSNWELNRMEENVVRVVNLKTWFTDRALRYPHNGHVVYDRPENIPAYVKKAVNQMFANGS